MDQLVLLVLIGLISLINWAIKRSAEMREKRRVEKAARQGEPHIYPQSSQPPPPPTEDPTESMRKLMEALGLPVEAPPPPVLSRQPPIPAIPPPPAFAAPSPASAQALPPARPRQTPSKRPALVASTASTVRQTRFGAMLHQPGSARDAIVLAEILGTPIGLRD